MEERATALQGVSLLSTQGFSSDAQESGRGCNFFWVFFPVFFLDFFPVFWGLMVLIGICSVLQLSSLICMVLFVVVGWLDGWMVGWLVGWCGFVCALACTYDLCLLVR